MIFVIKIPILCGIILIGVHLIDAVDVECDSISSCCDYGRRFCFFRHLRADQATRITIKPNPIADEKRELIFDNCTLYTLPSRIFDEFPNLKTIYTWNTKLKTLTTELFHNANHLSQLDLSQNLIETLPPHTFSLAMNLKDLDLSSNMLRSIDVDTFAGLRHLNTLRLDHNKLELIPANAFSTLHQLKTVRLNHNLIRTIPVELFAANLQLQNIYLNDNSIEWMMGEQTFRHLSQVLEFDLHNNPIINLVCCVINAQSIDIRNTNARCCYIGGRTKRIFANNNRISYVVYGNNNASTVGALQHIDLANNKLSGMKNLTQFTDLRHFDVSNNRLSDIGLNSFAAMHHLEVLNLRNSGLRHIYFGSFSHKSHLKKLDISYNELTTIDFRMFMSMAHLKELHLDANNITDMDMTEIRKIFPLLTKIGISKNNWTCDNLSSAIKYLESNGITLSTEGLVENTENIKGIPCSNNNNNNNNHNNGAPNGFNAKMVEYQSSGMIKSTFAPETMERSFQYEPPSSNLDNRQTVDVSDKCHNSQSNYDSMAVMVRLIELKYETQDTVNAIRSISEKLENLLDQLQRDAINNRNDIF